jgi:glycosyltransferase involved in cell wall biosynthesis
VAVTFHEFVAVRTPRLRDKALAALMSWQTRQVVRGCDLALTTCTRYARYLRALAPDALPIEEIPVAANICPVPATREAIDELRGRYSLGSKRVFGVFGRLSPWRNYQTAFRVLARARADGLDVVLLMIGNMERSNPGLFQELQALARSLSVNRDVVVTGELPSDAVSLHLRLVDVFLFPQGDGVSTRSTILMSALAHGLPIVAYKPEAGNFDGWNIPCAALVSPGDESGFVSAALRLLESNADDISVNAGYYEKHFSWSGIARRYLEALGRS